MATPRILTEADFQTTAEIPPRMKARMPRVLAEADFAPAAKPEKEFDPLAEGLEMTMPSGNPLKLNPTEARVLVGAGKRLSDIGLRGKQVFGDEATKKEAEQEIADRVKRDAPLMRTTAGMLGHSLPDVIAGGLFPNTIKGAALAGLTSGMATPVEGPAASIGVPNDVMGPLTSGLMSAGSQAGMNALSGGLGKFANVMPNLLARGTNKVAGRFGKQFDVPPIPFKNPEVEANYNLLTSKGIQPTIGDIDPSSMWRNTEDILESIGGTRAKFMRGQQEQLKAMLENTRGQVVKPIMDTQGRRVSDTGAMAQGIKDKYLENKAISSQKFADVDQLAAQPGVKPVKPSNLHAEATRLSADKPEFFKEMQDTPLWRKVMNIESDAGPQTISIVNQSGVPFKLPQQLEFPEVQALRSAVGDAWRDADKPTRKRAYGILLKAIDKDLDTWGQDTGNKALTQAYSDARTYYKNNVVPYTDPLANPSKSPLFSNIAVKDKVDSDVIPGRVFQEDRGQLAQDFVDLSTPQGQQAAKNLLGNEIIDSGLSPITGSGLSTGMPRRMHRMEDPAARVFGPAEQQALDEATKATQLTSRAMGMPLDQPRTGFRNVPYLGHLPTTAAMLGSYYGMNTLVPDEVMSPTDKLMAAFLGIPALSFGAKYGPLKYAQSGLGNIMHAASPAAQTPGLRAFQQAMETGAKGFGAAMGRNYARDPRTVRGMDEDEE